MTDIVSSSNGSDVDHIVYDPYGNIVTQTNAADGDRFLFAGMEYDSTTGLYYDHARYYDSVVGRFVSQDPEGFTEGDTDLYRYVGNNPTGGTDTSGYQGSGSKDPGDLNPGNPLSTLGLCIVSHWRSSKSRRY